MNKILSMFLCCILLLTIRLSFLQLKPDSRVVLSYQNHQVENISDMKYMILDSNGRDMINYEKQYILVIDIKPFSLNNYEETLQDIMALNYIMKDEDENFNFSDIMRNGGKKYYNISFETYKKINSLRNIKGIYTYVKDVPDIKKAWNISSMFSDVLNDGNKNNSIQKSLSNELKNNEKPKEEFYLDNKAVYAKKNVCVNSENKNIVLTVDKDLQDKIYTVLNDEKYKDLKNIGVTLMESDTGKIKAIVQKDESEANINLGIEQIGYEPGSIYKIITFGAALDMGLINTNDTFTCSGKICKTAHGTLTVEKAFAVSCNDIFAQIGQKVGYEKLMEYSKKQGLYARVINFCGNKGEEAQGVQPKIISGMNNISIGQCMNVTPVQMLGAINTITNNGVYVKPYVVEALCDKNDNIIKTYSTSEKRIYSETTAQIIKNMMRKVVTDGTGEKAYINNVYTGGKTGSSTGNKNCTHGWFAGFFEYNNKNYTMIVFVPELKEVSLGGGNTAAPVFRDIVLKLKQK